MKAALKHFLSVAAALLFAANAAAVPYNAVYSFGDSLSDAGDSPSAVLSIHRLLGACDPAHPCPPYVDGHYSNGPTAAERFGAAVLPGGSNAGNFSSFAVAGATTGIGNFGDGGSAGAAGEHDLPGMAQQLAAYAQLSGGAADPSALYFVWGGANDFLTADLPMAAARNVAGYVAALAAMGARHLLVPNLPDLSLTPFARAAGLQGAAQSFSLQFNDTLAALLENVDASLPLELIAFDTFAFVNDVVSQPGAFGFADATHACLVTPTSVCSDPATFVFWDSFHPTTAAHAAIAAAFLQAVPEPGSIVLVATGIAALAVCRRLRDRKPERRLAED